jgi:hypothetical protein
MERDPNAPRSEFWQDREDGKVYAVKIHGQEVTHAHGPIHDGDMSNENLQKFQFPSGEEQKVSLFQGNHCQDFWLCAKTEEA